MSGKIEFMGAFGQPLASWVAATAVLCAAITDALRGKIFNWLTYPVFFTGLLWTGATSGWTGFAGALLGLFIVSFLFIPMFVTQVMGAGDVKLLMGIATWLPWRATVHILVLSVLVGGVLAAVLLVMHGKMIPFIEKMKRLFLSTFVRELALEVPALDRSQSFPFGVPIAVATWWVLWADPVVKMGGFPWDH